ncbi:MAG: MATE family efflux transporter, partial [Lachnospiraceae bacterium]|nr:MATE family efflux transporter [Lachnospiraceae bacterium]
IIMSTYFLCGIMDAIVGSLRGMGYSVMPMIVSLLGACAFRIMWIYTVFSTTPTPECLYVSYPLSWTITFLVHLCCFFMIANKRLKTR